MSAKTFATFLQQSNEVAGLVIDHTLAHAGDLSKALRDLRSAPEIDFQAPHGTSRATGTDASGQRLSMAALASRNEQLLGELAAAVGAQMSTQVTDEACVRLFNQLHHHAMDASEVLEDVATTNSHPKVRAAIAEADSLELCAAALIGFGESFEAGQQTAVPPKSRAPARRARASSRQR